MNKNMIRERYYPLTYLLSAACLLFFSNGCAKWQGLMTLKQLGESQAEMGKYLAKQETSFEKLVNDLKNEKLKAGISQKNFFRVYGEPVLTRPWQTGGEVLLYRHPTNYFTSDKVYLYFDAGKNLAEWQYKPYKDPSEINSQTGS